MNYGEFKVELEGVLFNDVGIPTEKLIPIVMQELRKIAYLCIPLALVVKSPDFRIIRDLGDGFYLKESNLIRDNNSKIDLDKELVDALLNMVASRLTNREREFYKDEAQKVIADFNWKMLEAKNNGST